MASDVGDFLSSFEPIFGWWRALVALLGLGALVCSIALAASATVYLTSFLPLRELDACQGDMARGCACEEAGEWAMCYLTKFE